MRRLFMIEDELHAEPQATFDSLEDAVTELRRRASLPWDDEPNRAPCTNWRNCGRKYEIVELEGSNPSREVRRLEALEVSAAGVVWSPTMDGPLGAD